MAAPILLPAIAADTPINAAVRSLQDANQRLIQFLCKEWRDANAKLWGKYAVADGDPGTRAFVNPAPSVTIQNIFDTFDTNGQHLLDTMQARLDAITAIATANGGALNDYITVMERATPAYTVSGGKVTLS